MGKGPASHVDAARHDRIRELEEELAALRQVPLRPVITGLRQARIKKGWNQHQVAEMLQVAQSTISKLETGDTNPSLGLLCRYADLFDLDVSLVPKPPREEGP